MSDKHAKKGASLRKQSHTQINANQAARDKKKTELEAAESLTPIKTEDARRGKK